jgi:hypothetical protein
VIGGVRREGPRLKELGVSSSSYGSAIPRQHGRIRAPGTIIWATDLAERREESGGGKGRPSTTGYSYSVSFAVALSSRPIVRVDRIWADGNLLRGAAGDLKTGGTLRVHTGHGDQAPDPLIASAEPSCPAFRSLAYCVFEALELADFGNRIPALTFEIVADEEPVTIGAVIEPLGKPVELDRSLDGLQGFSDEGGPGPFRQGGGPGAGIGAGAARGDGGHRRRELRRDERGELAAPCRRRGDSRRPPLLRRRARLPAGAAAGGRPGAAGAEPGARVPRSARRR